MITEKYIKTGNIFYQQRVEENSTQIADSKCNRKDDTNPSILLLKISLLK